MKNTAGKLNYSLPDFQKIVEENLEKFFSTLPDIQPISQAVKYVLQSGGKRIRPSLSLAILSDLQSDLNKFSYSLLALELLHIASLVHDDLPALDNDDMRRGKATCHVKFNEGTAILTGDILVVMAINLLQQSNLSAEAVRCLTKLLSKAYEDLCYGQQLDLLSESKTDKIVIAKLKTGALFSAAVGFPFIMHTDEALNPLEQNIINEIGMHIGILYQIFDDLADNQKAGGFKGREVSSDIKNNKETFLQKEKSIVSRLIYHSRDRILDNIKILGNKYPYANNFSNFRNMITVIFSLFNLSEDLKIIF